MRCSREILRELILSQSGTVVRRRGMKIRKSQTPTLDLEPHASDIVDGIDGSERKPSCTPYPRRLPPESERKGTEPIDRPATLSHP